jgi:hypothetical protein
MANVLRSSAMKAHSSVPHAAQCTRGVCLIAYRRTMIKNYVCSRFSARVTVDGLIAPDRLDGRVEPFACILYIVLVRHHDRFDLWTPAVFH